MAAAYGNVGKGCTWVEVDGVAVDTFDEDLLVLPDQCPPSWGEGTRTDRARRLLRYLDEQACLADAAHG